MILIEVSQKTVEGEDTGDPIHVYTQFYLPVDGKRRLEILWCLKKNAGNPAIATITLLNERIYTDEELGVSSLKIRQVVIGARLKFSDFFERLSEGYNVLCNADIFFDETLARVRRSDIHCTKKMYALLRYEYRGEDDLEECPIFGPRNDSMDTWIIHSAQGLTEEMRRGFRFFLGAPGCDNKVAYLFRILGYTVYNDPVFIRTYHNHAEETRRYALARVKPPYMLVAPARMGMEDTADIYHYDRTNNRLMEYIRYKLASKAPFVIPRIAGVENNSAMIGAQPTVDYEKFEGVWKYLKNNAGISVPTVESLREYSRFYLNAFHRCDIYASWEPWGHYIPHIQQSHDFITTNFPKPQIWAFGYDIFHYIHGTPWTHALRGKRLLIISPFVDLFEDNAYQIRLFPECTFVFLKPPQTQGEEYSGDWRGPFAGFCDEVRKLEFDVALCSCGGYGNPICGFIHSIGKSAIYVGGVLQMYFGVYGNRWLDERKDAVLMYMSDKWQRPSMKPRGYKSIENGCYW